MEFSLELTHFIVFFTFFCVGVVQSISGFGGGLIAAPTLVLFFPMTLVTPLISLQAMALTGKLTLRLRSHIRFKRFFPLFLVTSLCTPIGVSTVLYLDVNWLKVIVGILVLTASALLIKKVTLPVKERKSTYAATGLLSGVLNGISAIPGPPAILLFANLGVIKDQFRANLSLLFFISALTNVLLFSSHSLLTPELLTLGLIAIPSTLVGSMVGTKLAVFVNEALFRKLVIGLISLSGINLLFNGLGNL